MQMARLVHARDAQDRSYKKRQSTRSDEGNKKRKSENLKTRDGEWTINVVEGKNRSSAEGPLCTDIGTTLRGVAFPEVI